MVRAAGGWTLLEFLIALAIAGFAVAGLAGAGVLSSPLESFGFADAAPRAAMALKRVQRHWETALAGDGVLPPDEISSLLNLASRGIPGELEMQPTEGIPQRICWKGASSEQVGKVATLLGGEAEALEGDVGVCLALREEALDPDLRDVELSLSCDDDMEAVDCAEAGIEGVGALRGLENLFMTRTKGLLAGQSCSQEERGVLRLGADGGPLYCAGAFWAPPGQTTVSSFNMMYNACSGEEIEIALTPDGWSGRREEPYGDAALYMALYDPSIIQGDSLPPSDIPSVSICIRIDE